MNTVFYWFTKNKEKTKQGLFWWLEFQDTDILKHQR